MFQCCCASTVVGHEHQHLLAVDGDREGGAHGDLGLAEADVTADEPVHRVRRLEVLHHRFDRGALVLGLAVGELALETLDPFVLDIESDAGLRLPLRVELQQLAGQLAQVRASAGLQVVPGLAAELRERRRLRVGADVAADLADLLVRDVDPVVAAIGEQEVVARDTGDFLRLESLELRDAMVLVHDVVAGPEIGEALQRAPRRSRRARQDVSGRPGCRAAARGRARARRSRGAPATRRRRGRRSLPGLEQVRLRAAEQRLLAQRLATVRERHDDVELLT